jgi:hypothetical protein
MVYQNAYAVPPILRAGGCSTVRLALGGGRPRLRFSANRNLQPFDRVMARLPHGLDDTHRYFPIVARQAVQPLWALAEMRPLPRRAGA